MKEGKENIMYKCSHGKCGEALYGFGLLGALIYYIQHATSFTEGVIGIIKAVGWPAVVLYKVLEFWNL